MESQIVAWLNGSRDFKTGVELLKAAGAKDVPSQETPTSKSKIFNALRGLLSTSKPAPSTPTAAAPPTTAKRDTYTASGTFTNPVSIEAKRAAELLFKEMQHVRAQLFALCPKEQSEFENEGKLVDERGALALRLMELQEQTNDAYAAARFAEEHGRLPEKSSAPVTHPAADLPRLISNLKKNIYRIRSKADHNPENLAAKVTELANLQNQLKDVLGKS